MPFRDDFSIFYGDVLRVTPLWRDMAQVTEGSPWHREESVLVHTDMVVSEYFLRSPADWSKEDMLGALACAFHDVGKPTAKISKYSTERGQYFAFHGHEQVSARLWEDYVVKHWATFSKWLTWNDIYKVSWMIEYHVPWALKDREKRTAIAKTANYVDRDVFIRVLMSDQWGRVSDDHEKKKQEVAEWITNFRVLCEEVK